MYSSIVFYMSAQRSITVPRDQRIETTSDVIDGDLQKKMDKIGWKEGSDFLFVMNIII